MNAMRPFTIRLIIAGFLFAIIVGASLVWLVAQIPKNPEIPMTETSMGAPSVRTASDSRIYSVLFCDLVQNPERYDRKLIQMRATVVNDADWAYVSSDVCPNDDGAVQAVGAMEPDDKLIESKSRDQIGPLLDRLLRKGRPLEVNAEMLGRFYAGGKDGRGHQFAIIRNVNARPTGRRMRR